MSVLERPLQVLLDEDRHRRLVKVARQRGVSVAAVVREAIDQGLEQPIIERRKAARRILDAPDMEVGEPEALRADLKQVRSRHGF
jgi:hypothetical protein